MKKFVFAIFLSLISVTSHSDVIGNYIDLINYEASTKYWIDRFALYPRSINTDLIANHIIFNAVNQSVPLDLLVGTIMVESRFNPSAKSKHGAKGILQVMTKYHKDKIGNRNIFDPKVGLDVGTQILSECLVKHKGNRHRALNCYNGNNKLSPTKYSRDVLEQSSRFLSFLHAEIKQRNMG